MVKRAERLKYETRDNAGILKCYTINRSDLVWPFGLALVAITKVNGTKYKKGDLTQVVLTGHKRFTRRRSGIGSSLNFNGVIPVKKDGSPLGTRVYGPVYSEARVAGYTRLTVLSKGLL